MTEVAADRSALAAERSVDEAKRSADAAAEAVGYQRAEVERGRVKFWLEPFSDYGYRLHNDGTDTAHGVHVDTGELARVEGNLDWAEFHPGKTADLYLSLGMGTPPGERHVTVTWHLQPDRSDEAHQARLPF